MMTNAMDTLISFEPDQETGNYPADADSRFVIASTYLRSLHFGDRPTELMPQDARLLTAARRFYADLNESDQRVIDSYSDLQVYREINIQKRNKRFRELCLQFMYATLFETLVAPPSGERTKNHEHD